MPKPNQINDLVGRASLLRKLKIYINQQLTLEFLLPLHHQQASQTRMVKGLGCDRHGAIPSLLPSEAQIFCWRGRWSDLRGSDSGDTIINQGLG